MIKWSKSNSCGFWIERARGLSVALEVSLRQYTGSKSDILGTPCSALLQLLASISVQKPVIPKASFGLPGIVEMSTLLVKSRAGAGGGEILTENKNIMERFQNMYSRLVGKLFSRLFAICKISGTRFLSSVLALLNGLPV